MDILDQWLILPNKEECIELADRLRTACKKDKKKADLGVPLSLSDGKWAQCVEGGWDYLTQKEKNAIVAFEAIKHRILVA